MFIVAWLRGSLRLIYFLLATVVRVAMLMMHHWLWPNDEKGILKQRQSYVLNLTKVMGFHFKRYGDLPTGRGIVMGNHRSYFDPALIVHDLHGYPVAMAEVEKWPILGYGAKLTGVVFVRRTDRKSRAETLVAITDKIEEGNLVFLFPEGTTKGDRLTGMFKLGGFNLAASNQYTIWPVAIEYGDPDNYWVSHEFFLFHLFRQLCKPHLDMHIWYGPPMTDSDGNALMLRCKAWIDTQLEAFHSSQIPKAST
jgi:lyso-ornithine lipid O-acyltransferase